MSVLMTDWKSTIRAAVHEALLMMVPCWWQWRGEVRIAAAADWATVQHCCCSMTEVRHKTLLTCPRASARLTAHACCASVRCIAARQLMRYMRRAAGARPSPSPGLHPTNCWYPDYRRGKSFVLGDGVGAPVDCTKQCMPTAHCKQGIM